MRRKKSEDLKEGERRRLGGKLPPGYEQLLHYLSFRIHSHCCTALLYDALRVCSRARRNLYKGLQSGNNFLELSFL